MCTLDETEVSVTKSASDTRCYRALILNNKLKVLLISDQKTDKAAGSLSVGAGSLCDPVTLPGIAHFCEHMLFLGTEKYPEENGFDKFVSDNGGSSNAYTDEDHTNYHFDVSPAGLKEALDRFAYFFINPLFNANSTEREIQAVNSEFEQNTSDDDWRMAEIQKRTSNPQHPYQTFSIGNQETLWTRPRKKCISVTSALMDYHKCYYSANIMTLAVLGSETLDELEEIIRPVFSKVLNKDVPLPLWTETPFGPDYVQQWIRILPIKDIRQMSIVFPFPDCTHEYKAASDHYLTHLLGHEGKGSILSLLKKKNWANELSAEIRAIGRGFGAASLEIELTKDGLNHVNDIATIVFQYLEMVRSAGPQQWVWEELRSIEAMNFRFKDQQPPEIYTCNLTPKMLLYPLEDVLSAEHIISEFKPEEIINLLTHLVPEKVRITVVAKENSTKVNLVEEFFKIHYSIEQIEPELITKWKNCGFDEGLQLPTRNEFIPTVFDLKPRQDWGIIPELIVNNEISHVFFLQDNEFMLPKATVRVEIFSPLPLQNPKNQGMIGLLKRTLEDSLSEFSYNAHVAGLKYTVLDSVYGLEVLISGYDHKLGVLLEKVIERMVNYTCDGNRFDVIKEAYLRFLRNWEREQPRKHANWFIGYLLRDKRWTCKEQLDAIQGLTIDELIDFVREFVSNVKLEWLVYGNLTQEEGKDLVSRCQKIFESKGTQGLPKEQELRLRELKLQAGSDYLYTSDHLTHSDSCTTVLFQSGAEEPRANVLVELIDQLANESCYTQLRTKEQLGYTVWTTVRKSNGTRGFQILVQSAYEPSYLECRIDCYLETFHETLQEMSNEDFLQHRNALAIHKAEKPKEQGVRADHLWSEISTKQLRFNRVEEELKELEKVTLSDALQYFEELIGPTAAKRKRLNVHIISKAPKKKQKKIQIENAIPSKVIERDPCKIEDVCNWKAEHEFYPAAEFPTKIELNQPII